MLYKRGNTYWVRFTTPSGTRIRRSAKTQNKREAQEFHDQLKAQYWREGTLGEQPEKSWQEAVVRWLQETSHKASHEDDKFHLRWVDPYLRGTMLNDVNRDVLDQITAKRLEDGVANATVNRLLEVVRAILRRSEREWGWLGKAPHIRMLPEPKRRIRWHDLRHTWASWHVQQGTPLAVLQELGGWESSEMVRRYAHFGKEHTALYANQLSL